jgi:hypothetical protein
MLRNIVVTPVVIRYTIASLIDIVVLRTPITYILDAGPKPIVRKAKAMEAHYLVASAPKPLVRCEKFDPPFLSIAHSGFTTDITRKIKGLTDRLTAQGNNPFKKHQHIVAAYLAPETPYRGLLVYHGLGSGKTCTSILASSCNPDKRTWVLLPASLRDNYIGEIQSKCGDAYVRDPHLTSWKMVNSLDEITSPLYRECINRLTSKSVSRKVYIPVEPDDPAGSKFSEQKTEDQIRIRTQVNACLGEKYNFMHYNAPVAEWIKHLSDADMQDPSKNLFSNSTIVIDESHNLINSIKNILNLFNFSQQKKKGKQTEKEKKEAEKAEKLHKDKQIVNLTTFNSDCNNPHEMQKIDELQGKLKLEKDHRGKTMLDTNPAGKLKLYLALMHAVNAKIVLLSGTPVVNIPVEIGISLNLCKGFIKTLVYKDCKAPINNVAAIRAALDAERVVYDSVIINMPDLEIVCSEMNVSAVIAALKKMGKSVPNPSDICNHTLFPNMAMAFNRVYTKIEGEPATDEEIKLDKLSKHMIGMISIVGSEDHVEDMPREVKLQLIPVPIGETQIDSYCYARDKEEKSVQGGIQTLLTVGDATSSFMAASRIICNITMRYIDFNTLTAVEETQDIVEVVEGFDEDVDDVKKIKKGKREEKKSSRMKSFFDNADRYFLEENIIKLAPKFVEILKKIYALEKLDMGLHMLYSNFVQIGGLKAFSMYLDRYIPKYGPGGAGDTRGGEIGWCEFDVTRFDDPLYISKNQYIFYTGDVDEKDRKSLLRIYNSSACTEETGPDCMSNTFRELYLAKCRHQQREPDADIMKSRKYNLYGDIIKIIMISPAGGEGINLLNTRYVHIMEPFWHQSRIKQIIGRANRLYGHKDLPPDKRTVSSFMYLTTLGDGPLCIKKKEYVKGFSDMNSYSFIPFKDFVGDGSTKRTGQLLKENESKYMTTDQVIESIAMNKFTIVEHMLQRMKTIAIDCKINCKSDELGKRNFA